MAALLLAGAGLGGGWLLLRRTPTAAVAGAVGLGLAGHGLLAAGLAPRLSPLWLSARTAQALKTARLLPEQGLVDTPVTVAGYAEPSLVFAVGTETELAGAEDAAQAIAENRPAVVEQRQQTAFLTALTAEHATARKVATIKGLDYSSGKPMTLGVYEAETVARRGVVP